VRTAVGLSAAAVAVAAPALVLSFLEGDGIAPASSLRVALLSARAVATALVLTGGAAYLAHAYATLERSRGALALCWIGAVACSAILIAPAIVAGLDGTSLARVLVSAWSRWCWAVAAVLGTDLVAAGAMLAAATRQLTPEIADPVTTSSRHLSLGLAALQVAVESPAPPPHPTSIPDPVTYACPAGCGRSFDTLDRARGHLAQCPKRRAERTAAKAAAQLPSQSPTFLEEEKH
jgi:hypothetical protein